MKEVESLTKIVNKNFVKDKTVIYKQCFKRPCIFVEGRYSVLCLFVFFSGGGEVIYTCFIGVIA